MKHPCLCAAVIISLGWGQSTAQGVKVPSRLDVTLSGGAAFPVGDFASPSSAEAGFASTGFALAFAMTYRAIDYLDVGGQIVFSSNKFDEVRFSSGLGIPAGVITTGYYVNMGFLAMAGFTTAVAASVDYNIRLYGGMMWAQSPEFKGTWAGLTDKLLPSGSGYPLVYGMGTGVKIYFVDLSVRYLMANAEYEIDLGGEIVRITQPVDLIQVTIGYIIPIRQ